MGCTLLWLVRVTDARLSCHTTECNKVLFEVATSGGPTLPLLQFYSSVALLFSFRFISLTLFSFSSISFNKQSILVLPVTKLSRVLTGVMWANIFFLYGSCSLFTSVISLTCERRWLLCIAWCVGWVRWSAMISHYSRLPAAVTCIRLLVVG